MSRAGRSWIVPTPRLAMLLAGVSPLWLLSATDLGAVIAWAAVTIVIGAVLYDLITLPAASAITIEREVPSRVGLADETELSYTLLSAWPAPLRLQIHEKLPPALRPRLQAPLVIRLDEGQAVAASAVTPVTRGTHHTGGIGVRLSGRLQLLARAFSLPMEQEISVAPSLRPVKLFRLRAMQARTREAGPRVLRQRGESLQFSALRAYTPGDDPRRIDWKATARQREPIVREYDLEQGQTVLIAIDAGRLMTQEEGTATRFEQALSSALVLATVAADAGDKVGLLLFDDGVRVFLPPRAGMPAVRAIRDTLVGAQPRLVEPDYAAAFATLAARQRRRALVVLFSDVIDTRSSRALIAHTARSASRHVHMVVALRSSALFRAGVPTAAGGAEDLYLNAAAEELVLAREEALQRMRRSGVSVVDAPADAVSASIVDRYLELKARGAI